MRFSTMLKGIQYSILTQAGIPIDPARLGLKLPQQTANATQGNFSTLLNPNVTAQNLQLPTPPTPPTDPANTTDQARYQQELQTYNQQFQAYHTRMMQLMNMRFLQLQQQMQQALRQNNTSSANRSSTIERGSVGVGGILDSESATV
jgi:hypothetical protein